MIHSEFQLSLQYYCRLYNLISVKHGVQARHTNMSYFLVNINHEKISHRHCVVVIVIGLML